MAYVWAHEEDLDDINYAIKTKMIPPEDYAINKIASAIDDMNNIKFSFNTLIDGTMNSLRNSNLTSIHIREFWYLKSLKDIYLPMCITIEEKAFYKCSSLTTVNLPVCTTIGIMSFGDCVSLPTVNLPVCTTIGSYAFSGCTQLVAISLYRCTTLSQGAFAHCNSLPTVNLPVCTTIESEVFWQCRALTSITLSSPTVCELINTNAFYDTPIASGTGHIYVPANLVATYKAATNWSTFANQIVAIE